MKENKILYIYSKYIGMGAIIGITFLYLILYFFPSLKEINGKKNELEKNTSKIALFQKEVERFQPPDEQEKALWEKVEKMTSGSFKEISKRSEFLKYVNSILLSLKNTLSEYYDDFLISIDDKNIKITQTVKINSPLLEVFKRVNEYNNVEGDSEYQAKTSLTAFQSGGNFQQVKGKEDSYFIIKVLIPSTLKDTSFFLVSFYKKVNTALVKRILIRRIENRTYYLIIFEFKVKRNFKNA